MVVRRRVWIVRCWYCGQFINSYVAWRSAFSAASTVVRDQWFIKRHKACGHSGPRHRRRKDWRVRVIIRKVE